MDIQGLDKKQLILLTLLITFVVSIATGIITVSLMDQMPKSVPQTINNVIQRTIEKVTTVQVPTPTTNDKAVNNIVNSSKDSPLLLSNNDVLINIYLSNTDVSTLINQNKTSDQNDPDSNIVPVEVSTIGQGIIISDVGLVLVDSNILTEDTVYKVILNKIEFEASVLKRFTNGFTILKISDIKDKSTENVDTVSKTQ